MSSHSSLCIHQVSSLSEADVVMLSSGAETTEPVDTVIWNSQDK